MDLSNLSQDLPSPRPVSDQSISSMNKELTQEFKNAANSVASLYRLANAKSSLVHKKGYLDALNDVLAVMEQGKQDPVRWIRSRRQELAGDEAQEGELNEDEDTREGDPLEIPAVFEFSVSSPTHHRFPPSMIAPSLQHNSLRRRTDKVKIKKSQLQQQQQLEEPNEPVTKKQHL